MDLYMKGKQTFIWFKSLRFLPPNPRGIFHIATESRSGPPVNDKKTSKKLPTALSPTSLVRVCRTGPTIKNTEELEREGK